MNNYVVELGLCSAANFLGGTANFSDMHGWISEMIHVEEMRRMENGESRCATVFIHDYCWLNFLCSNDDDSDGDTGFWDWPRAVNRRLSCTVQTSISCPKVDGLRITS